MAQFECKICAKGFEQRSRLKRHMTTSHPQPAPSAADLEKTLKGVQFPQNKKGLLKAAQGAEEFGHATQ